LASLRFDGVALSEDARLSAMDGARALAVILDLAAVGLAAEQVGGAEACLDMAVEYAKVRQQFGRPIGSSRASSTCAPTCSQGGVRPQRGVLCQRRGSAAAERG
jgi:alkylation response protein AidB-like acyl-CoA dehydrogenase